jgi:hypothetical protein
MPLAEIGTLDGYDAAFDAPMPRGLEVEPPEPSRFRTALARIVLLLLIIVSLVLATGSYALHRTLDPRPLVQDVVERAMKP